MTFEWHRKPVVVGEGAAGGGRERDKYLILFDTWV